MKPPKHLKRNGRAFFAAVSGEYAIDDPAGVALLTRASECVDRIAEAQEIVKKEGPIARDRYGSPKMHPAVVMEKDSRAGFLQAVKMLNLDLEPLQTGPGRPARGY